MAIRTTPERRQLSGRGCVLILAGTLLCAMAAPSHAERRIPWQNLSQDEQAVLRKHQRDWDNMNSQEQSRLQQGARQYLDLPQNKREAVERKRDQYRKMPQDERERLRRQYQKDRR